jgi:hypothetical protein
MNKWLSWKESDTGGRHYLNLAHVVRLQLVGRNIFIVTTIKETLKIVDGSVLDDEDVERAIEFQLD